MSNNLDDQFAKLRKLADKHPNQVSKSDQPLCILEVTVGRLCLNNFRNFLEKLKFTDHHISWIEGIGLIEHTFVIKSNRKTINLIKKHIEIMMML
jgi:hypothetical protein